MKLRRVNACLAVTCHLHFWQNDRDLLRAVAVTRRWDGYGIRVSTKSNVDPREEEEKSPAAPAGTRTRDFSIMGLAL